MTDVVAFRQDQDRVGIMHPAPDWPGTLAELAAKDVPEGADWRVVDAADLPGEPQEQWRWTAEGALIVADPDVAAWRATASLTRIEMALALVAAGILTAEQAEDFARGAIPAPLAALVETLPSEVRALARIKLAGANGPQAFPRADPFWDAAVAAQATTDAALDAAFGWGA